MRFHFKCSIDVNNREDIPDVLYDIIKEINNTEMYPNNHLYETLAWGNYKSEWVVRERDKKEEEQG